MLSERSVLSSRDDNQPEAPAVSTIAIVSITMSTPTPIDSYVLDVLMADLVGHDRKPSAFIVYLHLAKLAQRKRRDTVGASLQQIATETGLSKSSVQSAIRHLRQRQLLDAPSDGMVGEPVRRVLRPWQRTMRC